MAITQEPAVWSLFDHTVKRANHTTFPPPRDAHCRVHSDPKDALSLVRSGSLGFKCLVGQMLLSPLVLCKCNEQANMQQEPRYLVSQTIEYAISTLTCQCYQIEGGSSLWRRTGCRRQSNRPCRVEISTARLLVRGSRNLSASRALQL